MVAPQTPLPVSIRTETIEQSCTTEDLRFRNNLIDFRIEKNEFQDGETIVVTYTHTYSTYENNGPYKSVPSQAWFGIFPKSAGLGEWSIWQNVNFTEQPEQTMQFIIKAEGQVGPWELRFYANGGNESIVGRLPFVVTGESFNPISIELEKASVNEGETINVKYTIDPRVQITDGKIACYTKSTPSLYESYCWYDFTDYDHTDTIPIYIDPLGAHGWHEMRCFTNSTSYTPCLRVPFFVNASNPVKLNCYPRNIKDGSTIVIEWNMPNYSQYSYLCLYPEDDLVEENGFRYPIHDEIGSANLQIESGHKQTGRWEVRLISSTSNLLVLAVAPFTLIGAKEAFSTKLLENVKFMDIDIVTVSKSTFVHHLQ